MVVPLEDYALIGDCRTAALVSKDGAIDWWCAPRFDSAACFAALLGTRDHGHWTIAPTAEVERCVRSYRGETMVLETLLETATGSVALIECMVFDDDSRPSQIVRVVEGRSGCVPMRMELVLRFDYGSRIPWVTSEESCLSAIAGAEIVRLYTPVETRGEDMKTVAEFEVRAGERVPFSITHAASHCVEQLPVEAERALAITEERWTEWSAQATYRGEYETEVQRSLLLLKALTYRPTGGIVAAPTTSLPEQLGGTRNWDYRFCWLRDATISLYALLVSGYGEEAAAWRNWLLRAVAGTPDEAQVIYGIAGERRIPEMELPWLPGYADSRPVRIGNAAHTQLQLDVYGELMDAMFQCRKAGLENAASWALERRLIEYLERAWSEPDEGIWEIRGPRRHFTHSKVMAWVAFDRAIRSIEEFGREGPVERWRNIRSTIHADVCARSFSTKRNSFVQTYDSDALDASLLMLPLVGFLPVDDPRMAGTIAAIEAELLIEDTFVLRYITHPELDGLPEGEGAFLACSFWLVSNRVMQGRVSEARELFERLLALANDVGLLAEEYEPKARRLIGNYPQAFSHLALVDAAVSLSQVETRQPCHRTDPTHPQRGDRRSSIPSHKLG
ncbi:MAG: glucoamylase [Myxococcaceae bacterium]|nr:glucoamylase [Myxococcaceae bacterium]